MVAPRGNGVDTHRVYESLYLRVVPIVMHSGLDSVREEREAPVLCFSQRSAVRTHVHCSRRLSAAALRLLPAFILPPGTEAPPWTSCP